MGHLLYLMFRCDFDVMESLENLEEFGDLNTPVVVVSCLLGQVRASSYAADIR